MRKYNKFNFHKQTYCEFQYVDLTLFKEKSIHFTSKSGSQYFFNEKGVYRYSNHWGRVANCRWKIEGVKNYKNQKFYVGYADWEDFFKLNSAEKSFYLIVDYNTGFSKIFKEVDSKDETKYLVSLDFAIKRQKEIKSLFKDYKWAKYYHEDIYIIRKVLIDKLINSSKPFKNIKLSLNKELLEIK